jgi:peroxiredoxin
MFDRRSGPPRALRLCVRLLLRNEFTMFNARSVTRTPTAGLIALFIFGCAQSMIVPGRTRAAEPSSTSHDDRPAVTTFAQATPAKKPQSATAPQRRTAYFRADNGTPKIPKVLLSKREEQLCKVKVGDQMPEIALPKLGGNESMKLADLIGKTATVVVFWKGDRRMAVEQLTDLGPDVIEPFEKEGVAVLGIAVKETPESAAKAFTKTGAKFANLVDADGKAFEQVGSERLPRTYVLDSDGKIAWFDIEYSLTTRRELNQTLRALVKPQ